MDNKRIDAIIDEYQGDNGALIKVLLDIQHENRWLPQEALEMVSHKLGLPLSDVLRAATFHKAFSLVPQGRHQVHVCNGTTCHMRGAEKVFDAVQSLAGIPVEKFSLKSVTCLGCCSSGPIMAVDGRHLDGITPAKAQEVLEQCD